MAVNHVYVDPSVGGPGSGTIGDPWDDMQAAIDGITDGGVGNQINLKAGTAETLAAALTWGSYSPTNSISNPLMVRGYTSSADDDGVGEIDGDNAVTNIFSLTNFPQFVYCVDLKLHNTTSDVFSTASDCVGIRCEIYNGGSAQTVRLGARCRLIACNIHTGTSGAYGVNVTEENNLILFNRISEHDDWAIRSGGAHSVVLGNLIHGVESTGIQMIADQCFYYANTLEGDSSAGDTGILGFAGIDGNIILSNIIKDFGSGTGGAINLFTGNCLMLGHNNMHGNASDTVASKLVFGLDLTANDTTTDPTFTDAAGDDYSVGSNAKDDGYPTTWPGTSTNTNVDVGAVQRPEVTSVPQGLHPIEAQVSAT